MKETLPTIAYIIILLTYLTIGLKLAENPNLMTLIGIFLLAILLVIWLTLLMIIQKYMKTNKTPHTYLYAIR